MMNFIEKFQHIDRRIVYTLCILGVIVPFLVTIELPIFISPETKGIYDTIEEVPPDKIVLLVSSWDAGSKGENWPQTEAVIEHMMRKDIKFAIMSHTPQGVGFAEEVAELVAKRYRKKYGIDWCNFGYLTGEIDPRPMIQALCKDIPGVVQKDIRGTPITEIPMMKGIKDIHDIYFVLNIEYYPKEDWIPFVQGVYGTKVGFGSASIVSSAMYPYLESGQLCGLLVGVRGAAEYETLLRTRGLGKEFIVPQSIAHLLIVVLVIMANIGYWASRRKK